MLNFLSIVATANADCTDSPGCAEPYPWNCAAPGQGWSGKCEVLTKCQKSCTTHGMTCEDTAWLKENICANGDASLENGLPVENGGGDNGGDDLAPADPDTCEDTGHHDCAGDAWDFNCGAVSDSGDCPTATHCRRTCSDRYSITCEKSKEITERLCSGSGGGGGGNTIQDGECTRVLEPEDDATWSGYKLNMVESRDGVIERIGDQINVITAPTTPSWCKTNVTQPQAGQTMHWSDYYKQVGLAKLACVGWTPAAHEKATSFYDTCDTKNPKRGVFDFEQFAQAAGYFPDFANYPTFEQSALDVAAFTAHSSKETMGNNTPENPIWQHAWCWSAEVGFPEGKGNQNYGTQTNFQGPGGAGPARCNKWTIDSEVFGEMEFPEEYTPKFPLVYPKWNDGYYGRGSLQLTYCSNYNYFSQWVQHELGVPLSRETDFLANPGYVGTKDWAFASGLWFYMSPSADGMKPSMHSVVNYWVPNQSLIVDQSGRRADVGYQTQIINGGVECGEAGRQKAEQGHHYAEWRATSFLNMLDYMDYPNDASQYATYEDSCLNSVAMNLDWHQFWLEGDNKCSGDNISFCEDDALCTHQPDGGK